MHSTSKFLVVSLEGWYIDKHTNNYNRIKPENIIKLEHSMHNGLSIYQNLYYKTTFLAYRAYPT